MPPWNQVSYAENVLVAMLMGQDHISLTSPLAGLTKEVTSFQSGLGKGMLGNGF